jgi:hypothetical protein
MTMSSYAEVHAVEVGLRKQLRARPRIQAGGVVGIDATRDENCLILEQSGRVFRVFHVHSRAEASGGGIEQFTGSAVNLG